MPPAREITPPSPVPRVLTGSALAREGLRRYRIHADQVGADVSARYVLAADEEIARACYLDMSGTRQMLEGVAVAKGEALRPIALTVVELPG